MNEIITLIIILLSGMLVISVAYNWFKEREIKSLKKQLFWTEEKHAALQKEHLSSFINPHKNHELSSEVIEKHIQEIKTEIKRRKKPSIPKPRFKSVQEQIDEEHEKVKSKPGIGGESFTVKLTENWQEFKPLEISQNDIPVIDNEPKIEFGGGDFGGAGASDSWDKSTKDNESSDNSNDNSDNGYETTDKSEGNY